jgi:hypothetical protein
VILRNVEVAEGPFTGVGLRMEARNDAQDGGFTEGRDLLCVPPG